MDIESTSNSNAVSVAIPQPRVAGEDRYSGCKYDHYSNAVSVAFSRRRYPHQDNGRNYIGRYYQIEYNAYSQTQPWAGKAQLHYLSLRIARGSNLRFGVTAA